MFSDFILDDTQFSNKCHLENKNIMGDFTRPYSLWFHLISDIPKKYSKCFRQLATSGYGQIVYKPTFKLSTTLNLVLPKSDFFTGVDIYPCKVLSDKFSVTFDIMVPSSNSLCRPTEIFSVSETDLEGLLSFVSQSLFSIFVHIPSSLRVNQFDK